MKKAFLLSLLFITTNAVAVTPWWQQPTICRLNPANCYTSMGVGYDSEMWDANANCWGMKLICGDALTNTNNPTFVGKTEIAARTNINEDFDLNTLNGDCFGVRKTTSDGSKASVDGQMVRVWCNGVLESNDIEETIEHGDVAKTDHEPDCQALANNGYVDIQNGKCYGKKYDQSRYYIQCKNDKPILIILNDATNYEDDLSVNDKQWGYPTKQEDANAAFTRMYNSLHQ